MLSRVTATTPLAHQLLFWSLSGREALSEPFVFDVELLSEQPRLDKTLLLGKPMTVSVPLPRTLEHRHLNGKITSVDIHSQTLSGTRYTVYRLRMESNLWPLLHDRNQRIFQNQTVPEIIKTLLDENDVIFESRLNASYRPWEYCVQYQESSFNFISRLMELEGIYYYFEHTADQHTLILVDDLVRHSAFPGYETIRYHSTPSGGITNEEGIGQWRVRHDATPGLYSLNDYDFRKPYAHLLQARQNPAAARPGSVDVYDWPGHYVESAQGEHYARIRQQVWQTAHQTQSGTATALGIAPGRAFNLYQAPFAGDNDEYLTTAAVYQLRENRYASGGNSDVQHSIDFTVIPKGVQFRAPPSARWPRTYGPQTARVVCPEGQSIWTDQYGRVKVQFHWDREAKGDDTSSCWVRVSSAWASQGFGGIQIPRVNDEVVVDFINGDPDRPIIIGRVYNQANMPPWALPANATQMGFYSRTKDGSSEQANALRFEDKPGQEEVFIRAQKDMNTRVINNRTTDVGGDHTESVSGNQQIDIRKNQEQSIHGNQTETIDGDQRQTTHGNQTETIDGNQTLAIHSNQTQTIDGNQTVLVKQNQLETVLIAKTETIGAAKALSIGGAYQTTVAAAMNTSVGLHQAEEVGLSKTLLVGQSYGQKIGKNLTQTVGKNYSQKVDGNYNLTVGKKQIIEISDELQIKVGSAKLVMKKNGAIILKGKNIIIDGDHIKHKAQDINHN
ncbi:type VI secretion system tip protein VgrG [Serratia rubidaea]|uniref:type VI secretion system Vgr family protein n=1 Tax=Serratia rubidaea TaxID=61652 RepID=UPI002DB8B810|nr:type VI secretion system tip protein TssI/VgrG [Serratia rubidaea]MEB7585484.1 type VI secretion system tip protein VgrG [Serratia rubidaea]